MVLGRIRKQTVSYYSYCLRSVRASPHAPKYAPNYTALDSNARLDNPPEESINFNRDHGASINSKEALMMSSNLKKILRLKQVQQVTGLSRSTIYRLIAADQFPKKVCLSPGLIGFYEHEIEAWLDSRQRAA